MSENTKIEWATHTFNPWIGCQKIGPGCDNCYAEAWDKRFAVSGHAYRWGANAKRTRTGKKNWNMPLRWNKTSEAKFKAWEEFKQSNPGLTDEQLIEQGFIKPTRPRVFCASLADVFDNAVPAEWRSDLFSLIGQTPYLDWLIVTKRIGNLIKMLPGDGMMFDLISDRVWLGITVCNQEEADRDIPKLLSVPAHVRWLSVEPLLGPIDIHHRLGACVFTEVDPWETGRGIDWVVVGGESGPNARPMHPNWARSLRDQCAAADVPFLFKQWGEWWSLAEYSEIKDSEEEWSVYASSPASLCKWLGMHKFGNGIGAVKIGKKNAGRLLDGALHDGYPII